MAAPTEGVSRKWLQEPLQEKRIWKKVNSAQPKLVLKKYEKLCLFLFGSQIYVKLCAIKFHSKSAVFGILYHQLIYKYVYFILLRTIQIYHLHNYAIMQPYAPGPL